MNNPYIPFPSEILEVIRHTQKEYTFRMAYTGEVKPGQFFEGTAKLRSPYPASAPALWI